MCGVPRNMSAVLIAMTAAPFVIATCVNLTHRPVRVERSRDTHRCSARSMGVSTSLDTNGPGRVPIKRSRFQALDGREAGRRRRPVVEGRFDVGAAAGFPGPVRLEPYRPWFLAALA